MGYEKNDLQIYVPFVDVTEAGNGQVVPKRGT
jgi:hypothetical protein